MFTKTQSEVKFFAPEAVTVPEDFKQTFEDSRKAEDEAESAGYAAHKLGVYAAKFQSLYNQMWADFKDDKSFEYHSLTSMLGGDDDNILERTEALIKLCMTQRDIAKQVEADFSAQAEEIAEQDENDRVYGTYEEQVNSYYNSTRI